MSRHFFMDGTFPTTHSGERGDAAGRNTCAAPGRRFNRFQERQVPETSTAEEQAVSRISPCPHSGGATADVTEEYLLT